MVERWNKGEMFVGKNILLMTWLQAATQQNLHSLNQMMMKVSWSAVKAPFTRPPHL